MALNLPNNLVFVPLDVLTAEELNQLMANDTFIAKQFPLSDANIADGAIGSGKINWSTMWAKSTQSTSEISISTAMTKVLAISIADLPVGAQVLVLGQARGTGTDLANDFSAVVTGGLEVTSSPQYWKGAMVMGLATRSATLSEVSLSVSGNASAAKVAGCMLIAIRVA